MFHVNNRNSRKRCETSSQLPIKTLERRQWRRSGVFIVNSTHVLHFFLVFLLLTLNRQMLSRTWCHHNFQSVWNGLKYKHLDISRQNRLLDSDLLQTKTQITGIPCWRLLKIAFLLGLKNSVYMHIKWEVLNKIKQTISLHALWVHTKSLYTKIHEVTIISNVFT